jgi:hypothetical protein
MLDETSFNNTKDVLLGVYSKRIEELKKRLERGQGINPNRMC